jgi:hypothetical protein
VLDVDAGPGVDLRTVSAIGFCGEFNTASGAQDGRGLAFTNNGLLTYTLAFTNGTSGVFVSSITPVPEPATAGLMAWLVAAALSARWCRRTSPTARS